jgi:hypothetical protein
MFAPILPVPHQPWPSRRKGLFRQPVKLSPEPSPVASHVELPAESAEALPAEFLARLKTP